MAPLLTFIAALAALGAASGVPLPSVTTAMAGEPALRGGRKLQEGYCNSIPCPDGYTPIDNAWEVSCNGDTCEESQCCEAFCSYHPCPENFVPIPNAQYTMCPGWGCSTELCCVDTYLQHDDSSTVGL